MSSAANSRALAAVTARQYLLMAAYSADGMQSLGFAYALLPRLKELYGSDEEAFASALRRHLEPVNTNPYLGASLVGAVANLEQAAGAEQANRIKAAASGPLAAMGDRFFWVALKPTAAILGVAAVLSGWTWGFALFLLLYSLPQILIRAALVRQGWNKGRPAVSALARLDLPGWAGRVALAGGAAAALVAVGAAARLEGQGALAAMPALVLSGFVLVRRRVAPIVLLYLAAAVCMVVPLLVGRGSP